MPASYFYYYSNSILVYFETNWVGAFLAELPTAAVEDDITLVVAAGAGLPWIVSGKDFIEGD